MRHFFLVTLCWGLSYCFIIRNLELDTEWELFKSTYGKNYTEKEESFRRRVWEKNLKFINYHNRLYKEGKLSYYLGMNDFGDMTDDEFKRMLNPSMSLRVRRDTTVNSSTSDLPKSVDWREHGYVTRVRNQGHCGSCWAVSAVGALEGQYFRKTGRLMELSIQNLVDCTGKRSCKGASMDRAFKFMKQKGIVPEKCYPYIGQQNTVCIKSECEVVKIKNYVALPHGNEKILMKTLATVGPVSVAINARRSFRYYRGGIYKEPNCKPRHRNHAVLLVGYGYKVEKKDNGLEEENQYEEKKYWIIKNSWGTWWGLKGYINLSMDIHNHCGIAAQALYPVL